MVQFTNHLLPATGGKGSRPRGATHALKLSSPVSAVSPHSLQNFHRHANILRPARGGWVRGLSHIGPKKWLNLQISKRPVHESSTMDLLTWVYSCSASIGTYSPIGEAIGNHWTPASHLWTLASVSVTAKVGSL
jgi:hypothetical protein